MGPAFYKFLFYDLIWLVYFFQDKLVQFILACQDDETGGFADRPGDMVSLLDLESVETRA